MQTLSQLKIGDIIYDLAAKFDADDNNIKDVYSTKEYVSQKISELVGSAPETLDTLNELAEALGKDPNFATTIATQLGNKVDKIEGKQLSTEDFTTVLKALLENLPEQVTSKYEKPSDGIPKTDLSEEVQTSLNKADSAIQDISSKLDKSVYEDDKETFALKTEIPTTLPASDVSSWAKASVKPVYTAKEIGLDKVNNTSDIDKPISTATQTALNNKVDKVDNKSLVADSEISKLEALNSQSDLEKAIADAKKAGTDAQTNLDTHTASTSNPHKVTKVQVGLGNVDNTSDIDKPISTATQSALDLKVDKVEGKQLSTNDYSNEEKEKVQQLNMSVQSLTQSVADIQGIEELLSYGISFDSTVADPKCTRVGNPLLHKSLPIQSQYRGCIVKDGILQYYLDPNDWSKKANAGVIAGSNGTEAGSGVNVDNSSQEDAILDGTDGEVCVETPEFYLKCTTVGNITTIRESLQQIDADYKKIPSMFIDAYRGTVNDSKLRSVVNTSTEFRGGTNSSSYDSYLESDPFKCLLGKPRTNISRANFRTYARNIGKELLSYDQYKAIFYWNYVIEYANFNSQLDYNVNLTSEGYHQGGLGAGLTTWDWSSWGTYNGNNPITPCGYGNDIGNFTGIKTITAGSKTFSMPRWRGFDNPFGDIWTNVDGCILNIPNMYIILNKDDYTDSLDNIKYSRKYSNLPTSESYIKSFQLGEYADIVPKTVGGSASTYMCDYYWQNSSLNTLLVGGGVDHGSGAGLASFDGYDSVGVASTNVGARGVCLKN